MFQQQMRPGGPGMQPVVMQSQSDIQGREKLATYIYEYLSISGATKTAETFKEEVLNNNPSTAAVKPPEKGPSFLLDWWLVFWDLYCAAPERREVGDAGYSQEAKYFHDNFIGGGFGPPGMNGGPPFGAPGMGMPGHDGMMGMHPGAPGFPPGRFPPGRGMAPGMGPAGFGMFPGDPRMGRMPPNAMRMPPGGQFPGAPPPGQMRPGHNPMTPGMPPRGYGGFMESPGQAPPPFPGASGMMPNGGVMGGPMAMSSPGMHPAPTEGPPGFMPLGTGLPPSSSAMPFGMGDPSVSMGNGASVSGVDGLPSGSIPATSLMNGDEIKQSPASTPRGACVAGGTPAPGSAQSGALQQPVTPAANTPTQPDTKGSDDSEISKIKEGLLDGFMKDEPGGESFFA